MTVVTGLTAERMIEMENATIIDGAVVDGELILITRDETEINAGSVIGPVGPGGSGFEICTSDTRPTYTVEEIGKAIFETDTLLIRVWTGYRFKLQEVVICTSSTRPELEEDDEGTSIHETDTGLDYNWTGTSFFPKGSFIAVFTNATERDGDWPSPPDGSVCRMTSNPGSVWVYEASMWTPIGGLGPGFFGPCLSDTAPLNCVLMYGQTIVDAEDDYPLCWANTASTWKSGSNLIVPDMRGRVPAGKDNMGGSAAGRLTSTYAGFNGSTLGAAGGDQRMQAHTHFTGLYQGYDYGLYSGVGSDSAGPFVGVLNTSSTGLGGSQNVQPTIVFNWALRLL